MQSNNLATKLEDLLTSGLAYKVIAHHAGCAVSTIYRIKTGEIDNPSYSVGIAIDQLHAGLRKKSAAKRSAA